MGRNAPYTTMGTLIDRKNILPDPSWYFPDARYSWDSRRWFYTWPSPLFPFVVYIHNDKFANRALKPLLRNFIEINSVGSIIVDEIDKSYRIYFSDERTWDHSIERTNRWHAFYFQDNESALMFKLKFSEYTEDISDLHPNAGDEYEKTSYYKKD